MLLVCSSEADFTYKDYRVNAMETKSQEFVKFRMCDTTKLVSRIKYKPVIDYPHTKAHLNIYRKIIQQEQPISFDSLCQRLKPLYGCKKISSKFRLQVERILKGALADEIKILHDYFICATTLERVPVRYRTEDGYHERCIEDICYEELMGALLQVLRSQSAVISIENLIRKTSRKLGFITCNKSIESRLYKAFVCMKSRKEVAETSSGVILSLSKDVTYSYSPGDYQECLHVIGDDMQIDTKKECEKESTSKAQSKQVVTCPCVNVNKPQVNLNDWNACAGLPSHPNEKVFILIPKTELTKTAVTSNNVNIQLSRKKLSHVVFQISALELEKAILSHPCTYKASEETLCWRLYIDIDGNLYRREAKKKYASIATCRKIECAKISASKYDSPQAVAVRSHIPSSTRSLLHGISSDAVLTIEYEKDRAFVRISTKWLAKHKNIAIKVKGEKEKVFVCNVGCMLESFRREKFQPRIMSLSDSTWEFYMSCNSGRLYKTASDPYEVFQLS